jgi:hypothetical protein
LRAAICTLAFILLLLAGFFATPGIFRLINPEYQLAWRTYGAPLAKVRKNLEQTNENILTSDTEISTFEIKLKKISDDASATAAKMATDNFPADKIAKMNIEAGTLANAVSRDLAHVQSKKLRLVQQKKDLELAQENLQKKIDASQGDSTNLYLVTRALALGAIGALMSIFAIFLSTAQPRMSVFDERIVARVAASMAMGAIISVVVVGLFFTGFISIFPQGQQPTGSPDFWKVTILCLLAGAFSDRLFQAASERMNRYLAGEGDASHPPQPPPGGATEPVAPPHT